MRNGEWDIRGVPELRALFPAKTERRGWWFKLDSEKARIHLDVLCKVYSVPAPNIVVGNVRKGAVACYSGRTRTVYMFPRNHAKTIWHEFYHHLDVSTNHLYDSSDRRGGSSSLAWQFAERLWEQVMDVRNIENVR